MHSSKYNILKCPLKNLYLAQFPKPYKRGTGAFQNNGATAEKPFLPQ